MPAVRRQGCRVRCRQVAAGLDGVGVDVAAAVVSFSSFPKLVLASVVINGLSTEEGRVTRIEVAPP